MLKVVLQMGSDDGGARIKDPLVAVIRWLKSRSPREKTILGCIAGVLVSQALLHPAPGRPAGASPRVVQPLTFCNTRRPC